jgi:hypothetical protein
LFDLRNLFLGTGLPLIVVTRRSGVIFNQNLVQIVLLFLLQQFFGSQVVFCVDEDTATNHEEEFENAGDGNNQEKYCPRFDENRFEIKVWYKKRQKKEVDYVYNRYDQEIEKNKRKKDDW